MFSSDTCDMIQFLDVHHVEYMIVGGYAAIFHGYIRFTADIDFFYNPAKGNCERLFEAFQDFWDGAVPFIRSSHDLAKEGQVLQFGQPPNRLDFINDIDGVVFEECKNTMKTETIECNNKKLSVNFIGLEQLIKNKKASGRPKDIIDADYLEKIKTQ